MLRAWYTAPVGGSQAANLLHPLGRPALCRATVGGMVADRHWLVARFFEQMGFMERSAKCFDDGAQSEAARLATSIRVLVHDTKRSRSLLSQLEVKDRLRYASLGNIVEEPGLTALLMTGPLIVMQVNSLEPGEPTFTYAPVDAGEPSRLVPFTEWWEAPALIAGEHAYTRCDLVLTLAHKVGGAHVDTLTPKQCALHEKNALLVAPDASSPIPSAVRTIATELGTTLRHQLDLVTGDAGAAQPRS